MNIPKLIQSLARALTRSLFALTVGMMGIAAPALAQNFVHPGMLHSQADLDRMRVQVAANAQPWKSGFDRLVANPHSQAGWVPRATATIIRGGTGQNYPILYNDIHAAYQNALRWKITGDTAHGDTARDILNAWSSTHTTITGNADRFLAAGIYGYQIANAAELMRGYPGFDVARFRTYLLNVYYPLNNHFLQAHNDACITNYWANWDQCTIASILAIAIFCDDRAKFDQAINYYKSGAGNGALRNAVPFLHGSTLGQWQEAGRDQGHCTLGVGLAAVFCEMAWNQGQDMYGWDASRIRKGFEYVAQYNRGQSVPFTTYNWGSGQNCSPMTHTVVSSAGRGHNRPVWAIVSGHYKGRLGLVAEIASVEAYMAQLGIEGGGGDYGPNSGGYDQLGFGQLCFTRTSTPGSGLPAAGTYRLRNRTTGTMLDTMGRTSNGAICGLWADSSSNNQRWIISDAGGGYVKLRNVTTGLCLDVGAGPYANGDNVEQWPDGSSQNMHWQFVAP